MRALACCALMLAACDPPAGEPAPAPSAPLASVTASASAAPRLDDPEGLERLTAGREPAELRYQAEGTHTVVLESRWDDALPAQEPLIKGAKERETVKVSCSPADEASACTFEITAAGLEEDDLAAAFRVPINQELATAVGEKGSFTLSPLGEVRDLKPPQPEGEVAQRVVGRIVDRLLRNVVPLPAGPVGVGGRWKRTSSVRVRGVPVERTMTYTLMARAKGALTITGVAKLKGGEPEHQGGVPGLDVGGYEAKSTATMTVILDRPFPKRFTDERTASFWTKKPGKGKQPWTRLTRTTFTTPK